MRYLRYAAAVLLILPLLFWMWQSFGPGVPIKVSPQTTYLTEPQADDGLPDYAGALLAKMRQGVTPENNGAIPFLQAMWPAELTSEEEQALCKELGMELPQTESMRYPGDTEQETITWFPNNPDQPPMEGLFEDFEELVLSQSWKRDNSPWLADWIDRHEPQFDLLHTATQRPKFYCPSPTLLVDPKVKWLELILPHTDSARQAVKCLAIRAYLKLHEGDCKLAWRDCQTILALSNPPRYGCLLEYSISNGMQEIGYKVAIAILENPALKKETARSVLATLKSRLHQDFIANCIDGFERTSVLTSILEVSGHRSGKVCRRRNIWRRKARCIGNSSSGLEYCVGNLQ